MFMIMVFLKLFHLFFLFVWVGSLLFLTRFCLKLERKLSQNIYLTTNLPAMTLAIALGGTLLIIKGIDMKEGWLHMKLTMATFLIVTDIFIGRSLFSKKEISKKYFTSMHLLVIFFLLMILLSVYVLKFLIVKNGG